jgi:hypothetical protein
MTIVSNEAKDTFAFVAYNKDEDRIIVSFRGTNGADFENWVTNLDAVKTPYKDVAGA